MQTPGTTHDFLQSEDLQTLSTIQNNQGYVFSLYLDLSSGQAAPLERYHQLLAELEQQKKIGELLPEYRKPWDTEASLIRRWFEHEQNLPGHGVAVFSCMDCGLWQVFLLPVAVHDRLVVSTQPYLRPLEVLLGEFQSTLLVLSGDKHARLQVMSFGKLRPNSVEVQQKPGLVQQVVDRTQAVFQELACRRLILWGSEADRSAIRKAMPEDMQQALAGEIDLPASATPEQILARVHEIEGDRERQVEGQRVEELISRATNNEGAVLGLEQTLLSVRANKVRVLIVEEGFHISGGECPNCGFLGEANEGMCLLCGMALRPEHDIIEVALKRVLDQGGEIDILRSPATRHSLEQHGRAGALLKEFETHPPEHETANQQPITRDGEIHHQTLRDETVQESFPASDPPARW